MAITVFISYATVDDNKVRALKRAFEVCDLDIEAIIAAARQSPGEALTERVRTGIIESTHFAPIITRKSFKTQWLNQEIGFAVARDRIPLALVEQSVRNKLKGFIHSQMDLPFSFKGNTRKPRAEATSFRNSCYKLIEYLDTTETKIFNAKITPTTLRRGEVYTTTIRFKGKIKHGFFDNYVVHIGSSFRRWDVDPRSFVKIRGQKTNITPGQLNGLINLHGYQYEHDTANLEPGKYKIYVRLYEHFEPGEEGRQKVQEVEKLLTVV